MDPTGTLSLLQCTTRTACAQCGTRPIQGVHLRCLQCSDYVLCCICYERGMHEHQDFIGIWISSVQHEEARNRQEADTSTPHRGTFCASCAESPITGDYFQCTQSQCGDLQLCRPCQSHDVHSEHTLKRITKEDRSKEHQAITCNHCLVNPICGIRFKCLTCRHVSLCGPCRSDGAHSEHVMASILKPVPCQELNRLSRSGISVHSGITCDNCGTFPITGQRYVCSQCRDYDLCGDCKQSGIHSFHQLVETRGTVYNAGATGPTGRPDADSVAHEGIYCNHCHTDPLRGTRYKCIVCLDYDLCTTCHSQSVHSQHRFRVMPPTRRRAVVPQGRLRVYCNQCRVSPIGGTRYRCTTCFDCDLCEACHTAGVHSHHRMTQFHYRQEERQSRPPQQTSTATTSNPTSERSTSACTQGEPSSTSAHRDPRLICPICMDREKNIVFTCGHTTCSECARMVDRCPICQSQIIQRITLYL